MLPHRPEPSVWLSQRLSVGRTKQNRTRKGRLGGKAWEAGETRGCAGSGPWRHAAELTCECETMRPVEPIRVELSTSAVTNDYRSHTFGHPGYIAQGEQHSGRSRARLPLFTRRTEMTDKLIEHNLTDEPVCPYCGYVQRDSFEMKDDSNYQCDRCEKWFLLNDNVSRLFTTTKLPCLNGDSEHAWQSIPHPYNNSYPDARLCKTCGKREYR